MYLISTQEGRMDDYSAYKTFIYAFRHNMPVILRWRSR